MMTKKEAQKMARLEAENKMLREKLVESIRIFSDNTIEIIELRARLKLIQSATE